MKKRITIITLSLALAVVAVGMVVAVASVNGVVGHVGEPDKTAVVDQTLDVSGPPTFSLDESNGTVTITRGAEGKVVVHAVKRATTDDLLNRLNVDIRQDGNRIVVQTTGEDDVSIHLFGGNRNLVDYTIQLPPRADLVATKIANGRLEVAGIMGPLDLAASNGTITARDVDGAVKAQSTNGRVTVSGGRGALDLGTSNGTITVDGVQAQGLTLRSSNGRVAFTGSLAPGSRSSVDIGNGSIMMTLPPDSALGVNLRSGNGSITVGFPVTTVPGGENKRNSVQGVINRPDADLNVHAGNGSITLTRQGG